MNFGPDALATRLAALAAESAIPPIRDPTAEPLQLAVALSGGADSAALLHAAAALPRSGDGGVAPGGDRTGVRVRTLRAIHVDHGLQSAAGALRDAAERLAAACRVPLDVLAVRVAVDGASLEAAARDARYAALGAALAPGEWLLTAHHVEDQAETLLLQLLRGAGLRGLAAMPGRAPLGAGWIVRPLLDVPRAALVACARDAGLAWHDDPMNADPRFDRAYLRSEIWPRLVARWPAAATTIARTAGHVATAQRLLDAQSDADLARVERGAALHVPSLLELPDERRAAAVRRWLVARHGRRLPPARRLALVDRELLRARGANGPRLAWDGVELRRYGEELRLVEPLPELPPHAALWPDVPLDLGPLGCLILERCAAAGADPAVAVARVHAPLSVRPRSGGERLRLSRGSGRRPLKDLLREARVPPWLRERVAVLRDGQRVVAVVLPDRAWVDADVAAVAGEPAYRIAWRDAPPTLRALPPAAPRFVEPGDRFR